MGIELWIKLMQSLKKGYLNRARVLHARLLQIFTFISLKSNSFWWLLYTNINSFIYPQLRHSIHGDTSLLTLQSVLLGRVHTHISTPLALSFQCLLLRWHLRPMGLLFFRHEMQMAIASCRLLMSCVPILSRLIQHSFDMFMFSQRNKIIDIVLCACPCRWFPQGHIYK